MSKNFLDAKHTIIFEFNVHGSVLLTRNIKQVRVVRDDLPLSLSNFQERRLSKEENSNGV